MAIQAIYAYSKEEEPIVRVKVKVLRKMHKSTAVRNQYVKL